MFDVVLSSNSGSLTVNIEKNIKLSMSSTTSIVIRVAGATQAAGSEASVRSVSILSLGLYRLIDFRKIPEFPAPLAVPAIRLD